MLFTTTVGSFPKPDYLIKARREFRRGLLTRKELTELEKKATAECVRMQEELGLDILVDGEMYRGDMATYFAENIKGFTISGLVRSYGNRYYRKPVVLGRLQRNGPITVEWFKFAQSLTDKPIKGMLTGPYTMMDWSFNEYYSSRRNTALALARLIHQEAKDLEKAGAQYIQIDEPAVSTRPQEIDLCIETMRIVTKGLHAKTITHICYGDFEKIYPKMLKLAVDQIDLEFKNRNFELIKHFNRHPFTKEVGFGVLDVHSHRVETKDEIILGLKKILKLLGPDRVYVDPDCGLKTRTQQEAYDKLKVMVEAVDEVRKGLGV